MREGGHDAKKAGAKRNWAETLSQGGERKEKGSSEKVKLTPYLNTFLQLQMTKKRQDPPTWGDGAKQKREGIKEQERSREAPLFPKINGIKKQGNSGGEEPAQNRKEGRKGSSKKTKGRYMREVG